MTKSMSRVNPILVLGSVESRNCCIPGCSRPSSATARNGVGQFHCRYHIVRRARFGSFWAPTIRAADLKPYLKAASFWLAREQQSSAVSAAIQELNWTLAFAGRVAPATDLLGKPAIYRANIAFARLREAGVTPSRMLAIYLGVSALVDDDLGSHRIREFKIVQAAKGVHRLSSGSHKTWEMYNPLGPTVHTELHVYPRSSGIVLRKIGEKLEKAGEPLVLKALPEILAIKIDRFGVHPSHLPGWRPSWDRRGR